MLSIQRNSSRPPSIDLWNLVSCGNEVQLSELDEWLVRTRSHVDWTKNTSLMNLHWHFDRRKKGRLFYSPSAGTRPDDLDVGRDQSSGQRSQICRRDFQESIEYGTAVESDFFLLSSDNIARMDLNRLSPLLLTDTVIYDGIQVRYRFVIIPPMERRQ